MWHRTVGIVISLSLSLLTVPFAATTQQAEGAVTIGYLGNASPSLEADLVDAFLEGLRQLGYVEGQNLVIRYRWAEDSRNGMRFSHASLSVSSRTSSSRPAPQAPLQPSTRPSPSRSSPRSLGTRWRLASCRASRSQAAM